MKLYLSSFRIGDHPTEMLLESARCCNVAVIQNALDCYSNADKRQKLLNREFSELESIGLCPVELDLRRYFSDNQSLRRAIDGFSYLWAAGGNTFVLRRAFALSGLDKILREKQDDSAFVYGGYSAGICAISPSLKGIHLADEPNVTPDEYSGEIIWEGFNLYPYCIAPHYRSDHPETRMIEDTVTYYIDNKIPFIALRDGEALVYETH
ncbi:MAG: Type 1 glutamine amidotransferase-like domain-containing protein [Planctomycetota bacterium]|jgi:dipeptidase E